MGDFETEGAMQSKLFIGIHMNINLSSAKDKKAAGLLAGGLCQKQDVYFIYYFYLILSKVPSTSKVYEYLLEIGKQDY